MVHKKTYLITGAAGFVGASLFRRLISGGEMVHVIVRKETNLWRIKDAISEATCHISDLANRDELKKIVNKIRPDIIYHLATHGAYSSQNKPDEIIQANISGTWNLLKAAAGIDYELFVNTGSSSEYGFKRSPMKETDFLEPASYYAVTKSAQTLLCSQVAREEHKPIVTLRPFSVYGPYEEQTRFVPTLMRALYFKKKMSLVSPDISRDHIYIDDMVDAYMLTDHLKKYPGEIFNIGTGRQSSIKEVVKAAVEATGETTEFAWGEMKPRMWDTNNWVADISKAKKLLAWQPRISLEKGLSLTWEWFKINNSSYRKSQDR